VRTGIGLVAATTLVLAGSASLHAATTRVDCAGGADPQVAVDEADTGDTLVIAGDCGPDRPVVIDKDLHLVGARGSGAAVLITSIGVDRAVGLARLHLYNTLVNEGRTVLRRVRATLFALPGHGIENHGRLTVVRSVVGNGVEQHSHSLVNHPGGRVTVIDSTLQGADFGPFLNDGHATVRDSVIRSGSLRGIANAGTMTLVDSEVVDNGRGGDGSGGGILNLGTMRIRRTEISRNTSLGGGGGISNSGRIVLVDSRVTRNDAAIGGGTVVGGGIENAAGGTIALVRSTVAWNDAEWDGGGIHNSGTIRLRESVIARNTAARHGGGVLNAEAATLRVRGTSVRRNRAGTDGGGIFNEGEVAIVAATFSANTPNACTGC
jgi:hypothetical protein